MKYKSKPVVIEAIQLVGVDSLNNMRSTWAEFGKNTFINSDGDLCVKTLEGPLRARFTDWVIKGTEGEFYPCKDSVFQRKYELVEE